MFSSLNWCDLGVTKFFGLLTKVSVVILGYQDWLCLQQWGVCHTAEFQPIIHSPKAENKHTFRASVSEREQWNHWWVISTADIYTFKDPGRSETRVCQVFADWRWLCFCWCWYFSVIICPHHVVHRDKFDLIFWLRNKGLTPMSPAAWNNRLSKRKMSFALIHEYRFLDFTARLGVKLLVIRSLVWYKLSLWDTFSFHYAVIKPSCL